MDTALREAAEEIGVDGSTVRVLGELTPVHVIVSGFTLHPVVGVSDLRPHFVPAPHEVAEVLEVSLDDLRDASRIRRGTRIREGVAVEYPYFDLLGHQVWGATAMGRAAIEGWVTLDAARKILKMAGQDFDALKKQAATRDFKPVPLGLKASLAIRNTLRTIDSRNVVAKLEGSDPDHKDEFVVYSAHWDHFGIGAPVKGDKIYNGAADNASGVSTVVEIARAFTQVKPAPRRSILFLLVTAEEQGLLGSQYYSVTPIYPLEKTLANINLDSMDLGDLLRLSLDNTGNHEVPLKMELEFLEKYLRIEQTRFADRLTVQFDIQPETLDARVPSLILQPLVENAIKHGVARKAGPGHIQITARRDGEKLWMEVRDDGVGLSQDGWRTLHKGIGVSTTRERLLHLFGADFRFEFHRHNPGLAVIVALPWRVESSPAGLPLNRADGADTDRQPRGALSWIAATVRHFALTHRHNRTGYQSCAGS